jgi:hypothetical protein
MKFIFILIAGIFVAGCTKELKYTKEELYFKALAADASVSFILPKTLEDGIRCTDYSEGCVSGHTVQVQKLDMIAVEFMTEEQAKYAAKKYRGYYVRNWFLDDVTGEPLLERFVEKSLEAKRP